MKQIPDKDTVERRSYRPLEQLCEYCQSILKRRHIVWRKTLFTLRGCVHVTNWGYGCPNPNCPQRERVYRSAQADGLQLPGRQFGRDLIVHVGYRRFWYHQTIYEIHDWLVQDLALPVSLRQVLNFIGDFFALLRAAQAQKVRRALQPISHLLIGIDGMQPEKGNACLYIVRELHLGVTLLAENLADSSDHTIRTHLFQPLKALAQELGLCWQGVVSDAQASIRSAVAQELPGVPHQACQSHCLRKAGELTFNSDRAMKKRLKATFRQPLKRLEQQVKRLPAADPYRPVLTDYADAMHSTLLEDGVAPFALGGIRIFGDLTALADSLRRCQKKGGMCFWLTCLKSPIDVCRLLTKSPTCASSANG